MSKKSSSSKKKRKFQENVFKEEEIRFYLKKIKKFAISEDDKSRINSIQNSNKKTKEPKKRDSSEEDEISEEESQSCEPSEDFVDKIEELNGNLDEYINDDELLVDNSELIEVNQVPVPIRLSEEINTIEEEGPQKTDIQPDYRSIMVERDFEIDLKRRTLPCCMMEQEIVDSVKNNDVVLITGDTGTGKSTQIPQFLYENGFCIKETIIGVTQTRRVACIAICKQISLELNSNKLVGYQIRYDKTYNDKLMQIKIMTDGILVNELKNDILLKKYSVIIIDEAHERKVNSDILIGLLSQIVKLRRKQYNENQKNNIPLKLIIMSATIRREDFLKSKLFEGIKHVHISSNEPNYTVHWNKHTPSNYLLESKKKIMKIHRLLPPGSILVFLTGKEELYKLKKMLSSYGTSRRQNEKRSLDVDLKSSYEKGNKSETSEDNDEIFNLEENDEDEGDDENEDENEEVQYERESEFEVNLTDNMGYSLKKQEKEEKGFEDEFKTESEEELEEYELKVLSDNYKKVPDCKWLGSDGSGTLNTKILHASQTNQQQMNAFIIPNETERIVILSTNVAETSITLPNIRYVVDCGKEKRKVYNNSKGYENYEVVNISKSSANQRSGRCGRVGHGHCYRLYTNSIFENMFQDHSKVEILETNLCATILFLVSLGINPYYFTFPTKPPEEHITNSLKTLFVLNSIKIENKKGMNIKNDQYSGKNLKLSFRDLLIDPFKFTSTDPNTGSLSSFNSLIENSREDSQNLDIRVTKLGRLISLIPLEPRYSKMIYCILSRGTQIQDPPKKNNFISLSFLVVSILSFSGQIFIYQQDSISGSKVHSAYSRESHNSSNTINSTPTNNNNCNNNSYNNNIINSNNSINNRNDNNNVNKDNNDNNISNKENRDIRTHFKNDIELYVWISWNYSQADDKVNFCRIHNVSLKAMGEIFLQANQLNQIVKMHFKNLNFEIDLWKLKKLNSGELKILVECVVEGLVDKIAVGNTHLNPQDKTKGYKCHQMGNTSVYLGKNYSKYKYECVAYNYLMGEDKVKMYNTVPANPAHLATLKSPLIVSKEIEKNQKPSYQNGSVMAYVKQFYQPLDYFLTITKVSLGSYHPLTYRVFAQAFCFGEIYPKLQEYVPFLVTDRDGFLKQIKASDPLSELLKTLFRNKVYNRSTFEKIHSRNPSFLFKEYLGMMNDKVDPEKLKIEFESLI